MRITEENVKFLVGKIIDFGDMKLTSCLFPNYKIYKKSRGMNVFIILDQTTLSTPKTCNLFTVTDFGIFEAVKEEEFYALEMLSSHGAVMSYYWKYMNTPFEVISHY